jgi:uncharacterized membrane protein (DUF441 family)
MNTTYILLGILVVTVLGKANSVAVAVGVLLLIKLAHAENIIFPVLQKEGMFCTRLFFIFPKTTG